MADSLTTRPDFVRGVSNAVADFSIAQVRETGKHDIDAEYFGDDWRGQSGVLMGASLWHESCPRGGAR